MKLLLVLAFAVCALCAPLTWPLAVDDSCNNRSQTNREVIAPHLDSWDIVNADPAGATPLDRRDRLVLTWSIHTSYALVKIWGNSVNTFVQVANATTSTGNDGSARLTFGGSTACYGTVTLEIWLGSLSVWGFAGVQTPGLFNITGGLWINTTRPVTVSDELDTTQVVVVVFPINIKVNSIYNIQLGTNLTVYGTSKISGSIILFKEHEWPSRSVTIYYLLSVQYPYRFTNGTNDRGLTLPSSTVVPTAGGNLVDGDILVQSSNELWYYMTNDQPGAYCNSTANGLANWCYQVVHVEYYINPTCDTKDNVLKFNGQYRLNLAIECRNNLSPAWTCDIPNKDWAYPYLLFSVSSNNICEKFLSYDGSITGHIDVYPTFVAETGATWDAALWNHVTQETFVPDNVVWFVIDLHHSASLAVTMAKVTVLNITFWKESTDPAEKLIWTGAWSIPAMNQLNPMMYCNNENSTRCKDDDSNPTAFWSLLLNHSSYLDLTGKYAMKLLMVAYIQVTYDWGTTSEVRAVTFSGSNNANIAPTAETFINMNFDPAVTEANLVAANSVTGMVVGIAAGVVALVAAVGFLIVVKHRRSKLDRFTAQVESTTA